MNSLYNYISMLVYPLIDMNMNSSNAALSRENAKRNVTIKTN